MIGEYRPPTLPPRSFRITCGLAFAAVAGSITFAWLLALIWIARRVL